MQQQVLARGRKARLGDQMRPLTGHFQGKVLTKPCHCPEIVPVLTEVNLQELRRGQTLEEFTAFYPHSQRFTVETKNGLPVFPRTGAPY